MNKMILLIVALCLPMAAQANDETTASGHGDVSLVLETVTLLTWPRIDKAFKYAVTADGISLGSRVGSRRYVLHGGPFENVTIEAFNFGGDPLGSVMLESVERQQRMVLRWNEQGWVKPYLGVLSSDSDGGSSRMAMELSEMPFILGTDPEHLDLVLFGEEVAPIKGRIVPAPFSFEDGEVIRYGPYIELPLP